METEIEQEIKQQLREVIEKAVELNLKNEFDENYSPNVNDVCLVYVWDIGKFVKCKITKKDVKTFDVKFLEQFESGIGDEGFILGAFKRS